MAYMVVEFPRYPLLLEDSRPLFHGLKFIALLGGLVVAHTYASRREAQNLPRAPYALTLAVIALLLAGAFWYSRILLDAENHAWEIYSAFIGIAFLTGVLFVLALPAIIDTVRAAWNK